MPPLRLWLDDVRRPPFFVDERECGRGWVWARTSIGAIQELSAARSLGREFAEASLDHDLGVRDLVAYGIAEREAEVYEGPSDPDDLGITVVNWMEEHDYWPEVCALHTDNGVGLKNMAAVLEHNGFKRLGTRFVRMSA